MTVLPGLPTTAEIFVVPATRSRPGGSEEKHAHLDQVAKIVLCTMQFFFLFPTQNKQPKEKKIIKQSGEEAKGASLEKTSPGEYSAHFRLSHDNAEARLFKEQRAAQLGEKKRSFILRQLLLYPILKINRWVDGTIF